MSVNNILSPFNSSLCKDRVVLVTGGATGIGFEIAYQFGKHGAKIIIMGRRQFYLDDALFLCLFYEITNAILYCSCVSWNGHGWRAIFSTFYLF